MIRLNINKKHSAQGGAVSFFIGAMLAVIIALQVAWPVMDTAIQSGGVAASSALTITGNATCGQLINITNVAGVGVGFRANTTEGCSAAGSGEVNFAVVNSSVTEVATNLTAAINANGTINATMTATSSLGVVSLAYDSIGTTGNSVATTTNMSNATWTGTTLSGGTNSRMDNMTSAGSTMVNQLPLLLVLVLLMVFVKAIV